MQIDMRVLAGSSILSGAMSGRQFLAKLLAEIHEPEEPELVFLDFGGIEVATASYLRESVLAFRNAVRQRRSNLYPVVANINEAVRDELVELVKARGDVLMTCTLDPNGRVQDKSLIGELDPKQRITFDLVGRQTETDAAALNREHGEAEDVKQTAWNNRLAALAARGLVIELSFGRAKKYKPLFVGA